MFKQVLLHREEIHTPFIIQVSVFCDKNGVDKWKEYGDWEKMAAASHNYFSLSVFCFPFS